MAGGGGGPLLLRALGAPLRRLRLAPSPGAGPGLMVGYGTRGMAEAVGTYLARGEVADRVLGVLRNFPKLDPAKVTESSSFQKDLGLDSLDTVEVVMAFEEEFAVEIPDADADRILSTADAINYFASHPQAK